MAEIITISGSKELEMALDRVGDSLNDKRLLNDLLSVAKVLQRGIRTEAPKGPSKKREWMRIKNAIVAKKYKRQNKGNPTVFVAIDRKKAPHAHIVEYGSAPRWTGGAGRSGSWATGSYRGVMPPNAFFRRGVDKNAADVMNRIEKAAWEQIEKAWNK